MHVLIRPEDASRQLNEANLVRFSGANGKILGKMSLKRPSPVDSGRLTDVAQNFSAHPRKAPRTCPAQPPTNIPGASGKMVPPEKHLRNEKLKALQAQTDLILDKLVEGEIQLQGALVHALMVIIDLTEALKEPEEPEEPG